MEITLDQFKGSEIMKGFESDIEKGQNFGEKELVEKVAGNFNKGLVDGDTFEKAIGEINTLGLSELEKGTSIDITEGSLVKGEAGWSIEKACDPNGGNEQTIAKGEKEKEDEDEGKEDDDVEKAKIGASLEVTKGDDAEDVAEGGDTKDPEEAGMEEDEEK